MNFWEYIADAFCETKIVDGKVTKIPSSKRIIGGLMMVIVLVLTTISVSLYGMTDNNKDVVIAEIITAGSLLGITTVMNGFRGIKSPEPTPTKKEEPSVDNPDEY